MADQKISKISLNDLSFEVVRGDSKKSGRPYVALRILTEVDGETYSTLVFINKVK